MKHTDRSNRMTEEFKVKPHEVLPDKEIVEYWRDGKYVACIYPHEDGIRIVSRHIVGTYVDWTNPPSAIIALR